MNISQAAKAAGLPTKTVRYYADIALVNSNGRSAAGIAPMVTLKFAN